MTRYLVVAAALTTGCAYSYEKAQEKVMHSMCDIMVDCLEVYADHEACHADMEADTEEECEGYDAAAAKDCVDGLAAQVDSCPTDILSWEIPAACGQICPQTTDTGDTSDTSMEM
jgi:hypothetical protein